MIQNPRDRSKGYGTSSSADESGAALRRKAAYMLSRRAPRANGDQEGAEDLSAVDVYEIADCYEQLMSALCTAAKFGCSERLEEEYATLRMRLIPRYSAVAASLEPHIALASGGACSMTPLELLENITRPATLAELLAGDSGQLIGRVSIVSEAVFDLCGSFAEAR